jgi:hypothetical protein
MVTIQFIPYSEIESLSSVGRIRKLLNIAKEDKIVMLQGRLRKEEEAEMIKTTMEEINSDFKGIELSVVYPNENKGSAVDMFKRNITNLLLGDRQGITVIGPASIVKDIKKNPNKIELLTRELKKKNNKRKK